jgi:hypothetical protein
MITPSLTPPYGPQILGNSYDITQQKEAFYNNALTPTLAWWNQALLDTQYYAGDQSLWTSLYGNLPSYIRKQFNINLIMSFVHQIEGHQMANRKSTIAKPIENADQQSADDYSKIILQIYREGNVEDLISEAFKTGSLITGLNLIEVYNDYTDDPISGDIKFAINPYNTIIMDPYWKRIDLEDCQGYIVRNFLTKRQLISMYPDKGDMIASLPSNMNGNNYDGKFQFTPQSYDYGMTNLLVYDQYYYRDYRKAKILIDRQTGETKEVAGDDERIKDMIKRFPTLILEEVEKPTVKAAYFINNNCIYHGPNPSGLDRYNHVPVVGYRRPEIPYFEWRTQGVVRAMRDPQFLYNRFIINMCDSQEAQVYSGWKYKENALVDPKDVFMTGNGKGIAIKEEAQMSDVEKIVPTEASQTSFKIAEIMQNVMFSVSGVNQELMGAADGKVGIVEMLRQGAALTTLRPLFSRLDETCKVLGEVVLEMIQTNMTPGKAKRILGRDPSPQFYNKAFGKYGISIEDGINTQTQRQMSVASLMELKKLGIGGTAIDKTILEQMTIPDKGKLMENIAQEQQAMQQAQQKQAQVAMTELQSRAEYSQAKTHSEMALAQERVSRVELEKFQAIEKIHEANKQDAQAMLDKIRALKELEAIDLAHVRSLIEMFNMLKATEQQQPMPKTNQTQMQTQQQP